MQYFSDPLVITIENDALSAILAHLLKCAETLHEG